MWNLYFMFEILASYNLFILDASMNLSSMMTCFIASPNKSDRSFTPHLLNHFIMSRTQSYVKAAMENGVLIVTVPRLHHRRSILLSALLTFPGVKTNGNTKSRF